MEFLGLLREYHQNPFSFFLSLLEDSLGAHSPETATLLETLNPVKTTWRCPSPQPQLTARTYPSRGRAILGVKPVNSSQLLSDYIPRRGAKGRPPS